MAFHIPFNQRASARHNQPPQPIYIGFEAPRPPRTKFNWWGFNGMWMSFISLFSAGFLSPVPLLISLVGLRRPGRKMATVGTFVSLGGILLATGIAVTSVVAHQHHQDTKRMNRHNKIVKKQTLETEKLLIVAGEEIVEYRDDNDGAIPSDINGNMLVIKHVDPWGESLRYEPEKDYGLIRSAGPDRVFDSRDDISVRIKGETTDTEPLLPIDM
jgi:hypothetical protein